MQLEEQHENALIEINDEPASNLAGTNENSDESITQQPENINSSENVETHTEHLQITPDCTAYNSASNQGNACNIYTFCTLVTEKAHL